MSDQGKSIDAERSVEIPIRQMVVGEVVIGALSRGQPATFRDQHGVDREVDTWLLTSVDGSMTRILSTSQLDHDLTPLVGRFVSLKRVEASVQWLGVAQFSVCGIIYSAEGPPMQLIPGFDLVGVLTSGIPATLRDQCGAEREVDTWLLWSKDGGVRILSTPQLDVDMPPLVGREVRLRRAGDGSYSVATT